ncbi:MAG: 3-oxoacyl-ACP reductase FabG [bacterium]|nr:3-oxoacyl-ACP reductase FabG [bacterium]
MTHGNASNKKVALVTGSTGGIGFAVVKAMLKKDWTVIANSRRDYDDLPDTMKQLLESRKNLLYIKGDVTDEEAVKTIFAAIKKDFRRIDVLVNNVGASEKRSILAMSSADFNGMLRQNLTSTFLCSKYAIRSMLGQKYGRIVNISSVAGTHGMAMESHYSAAKAGVIGFSKGVAKEFGSKGITCNTVAPGVIETESGEDSEEMKAIARKQITVNRLGTPAEVAGLVTFLASAESGYITGQVFPVDGGMRA